MNQEEEIELAEKIRISKLAHDLAQILWEADPEGCKRYRQSRIKQRQEEAEKAEAWAQMKTGRG